MPRYEAHLSRNIHANDAPPFVRHILSAHLIALESWDLIIQKYKVFIFLIFFFVYINQSYSSIEEDVELTKEFMGTTEFKRAYYAFEIVFADKNIIEAENEKVRQKKIGDESGYIDKAVMYKAGEQIVDNTEKIKKAQEKYLENGGKLNNPNKIQEIIKSCSDSKEGLLNISFLVTNGSLITEFNKEATDNIKKISTCLANEESIKPEVAETQEPLKRQNPPSKEQKTPVSEGNEQPAKEINYVTYQNGASEYAVVIPDGILFPQGESGNHMGQVFKSKEMDAELYTYGVGNIDNATIDELFHDALNPEDKKERVVTYKFLKNNWFVFTGYHKENIFYRKTILGSSDRLIKTIYFEFPQSKKKIYEEITIKISNSFKEILN